MVSLQDLEIVFTLTKLWAKAKFAPRLCCVIGSVYNGQPLADGCGNKAFIKRKYNVHRKFRDLRNMFYPFCKYHAAADPWINLMVKEIRV